MNTSRRQFMKSAIGLMAGCAGHAAWAAAKAKIPIGLQLYAVRGEFARSVPETLKTVGRLGYQGVEFWGYGGTPNVYKEYSAKQLRQILDEHGLKCCGMHLQLKALEDAQLQCTIENNQVLGNRFLIVAAAKEKMGSLENIKQLAEFLNQAHEKCKAQKMRVGYHAHAFDFAKIEGRFAWDHLFSQTRPEVIMQLDIGNCLSGGGDPIAMLKKFPGRSLTIHLREHEEKTFESDYYKEIFHLVETSAKTQWSVVEMGGEGGKGFDVPEKALATLRRLGK